MPHPSRSWSPVLDRRPARASVVPVLLGGVLLLASCGDASAAPSPDGAGSQATTTQEATTQAAPVPLVDARQALVLVEDGATLVDVRTPAEFAEGHVAGAVNLDLASDSFADDVAALDPDLTYVVYCVSGNRSGQATALMQAQGLERLHDAGPFQDLVDAGAPVRTG